MKASNSALIASIIALVSFLTIGITFLINAVTNNSKVVPVLTYIWIALIVIVILCGILVIIQTVREKRQNQPETSNVSPVSKDIATRFVLGEGPVTVEVPDAESAIKVLQAVFHGESSLKVEPGLTIEVKKAEDRQPANVPDAETAAKYLQLIERLGPEKLLSIFNEQEIQDLESWKQRQKASKVPETEEPEK